MSTDSNTRHFDVLILGGGFAGVWAGRALERNPHLRVGIIADQNVMLFHPMLAEVCGASVSPMDIVNPIRSLCSKAEVFLATIKEIDFKENRVVTDVGTRTASQTFTYEHLLIAIGGVIDLSRVPGMTEHGLPMKTVGDAIRLRGTIIDRLEEAQLSGDPELRRNLLSFAVVGGGYSGVETAGQIADLLDEARRLFPWLKETPATITLIHSGARLLPQIGEKLGIFSEQKLKERGVNVILGSRVAAVTASKIYLADRVISAATLISTIGNAPHPVIVRLGKEGKLPLDRGYILTDPDLKVQGFSNVWSAGDCAHIIRKEGGAAPATAQFALRQGTLAGRNIAAVLAGRETKVFAYKGLGEMASIGHHNAVANIMGFQFSGFLAWCLWRAIYLSKLPGTERKLRVVVDWILDVIFPRNLSLLRTDTTPRLGAMHLEPGDHAYSIGDPSQNFYIVKKGKVEIRDSEGVIKTISEGKYFGESELFEKELRRFNAVAVTPTEILVLPKHVFDALSVTSTGFASSLHSSAMQYVSRQQLGEMIGRVPEALRCQLVADRMQKQVVTIDKGATVHAVLYIFKKYGFEQFPVVTSDGTCTGVINRRIFLDFVQSSTIPLMDPFPDEVVSAAPAAAPSETIENILRRMIRTGERHFVVLDEAKKLMGVISVVDASLE